MAEHTYHLVFFDEQNARAAEQVLREYGQVVLREEEDDHDRFYRVTVSPERRATPYELDRIALRFGGRLHP